MLRIVSGIFTIDRQDRMPDLRGKTILILSPQRWGKMFLSKHHYAIELARRGNTVYFLNPPELSNNSAGCPIRIEAMGQHPNLFIVIHHLFFPYALKFYSPMIFHALMRYQIKRVLNKIFRPVDIVWSFDLGNLYPLRFFSDVKFKIFHPVDAPSTNQAIMAAQGTDIIFSIAREILEKYRKFKVPLHFINHGVSEDFFSSVESKSRTNGAIHVGLSGNFLRADLDREILLKIIDDNPDVQFELWGSFSMNQSNIGGGSDELTISFIQLLKAKKNVTMHGVLSPHELSKEMTNVDAFLICYDVERDQSKGTNYHKIMEYLSTGKVVISNNVSTYKDRPDLVQMVQERTDNLQLPSLFKQVVNHLETYNSLEMQSVRIAFANCNSYTRQLDAIEKIIKVY